MTPVLDNVSFSVRTGEIVVVVGPSGCGKSTLLNLIAGFENPSSGEIRLNGKAIHGPGADRVMMFQEHSLFPWMRVIDNIAIGLFSKAPFSRRKRLALAEPYIELVHLNEFRRSLVHELSGGMKQRVALARALAPEPDVLLVDEPFTALDKVTKGKLYHEIQEIFARTNKTVVMVTHDTTEAACLADRVLVLGERPARIKREILVHLPRPRNYDDAAVLAIGKEIGAALEQQNE